MEDVFNAEATATTRIIIFIKRTLRTDNTLYNYKETVANYDWKYYCRTDSSSEVTVLRKALLEKKIRYAYTKFSIFLFWGRCIR